MKVKMYLKLNVYSENNIFSKIFSQISIFFAKLNIWCKYCYFGNQRDFSAVKFINELMCDTLFSNNKNAFNEPRSNLDFWRKFRFRFLKLSIFDQKFLNNILFIGRNFDLNAKFQTIKWAVGLLAIFRNF